jgi:hypothetical protein
VVRFPEGGRNSSPLENFKTRYVVYPTFSMDTDSTGARVNLATQYTSAEAMNMNGAIPQLAHHMPLWRAQGPFTCACRLITVDYIVEYDSK